MLTTTSSAWFTSQPEYNIIQILDDDTIEPDDSITREQAIDMSSGSSMDFSTDDEKDHTCESNIMCDTITLVDTTALARNLESVVEIHEDEKQRERTLAAVTRRSAKYTYFSTSSSDDDDMTIPTHQQVDVEIETATGEDVRQRSFLESIEKKLKKYSYIPPIKEDAYRQLNGNRGRGIEDRDPDFFVPKSTLSTTSHTLPKNQRDTSKRTTIPKEFHAKIRENYLPKERPRRDPTQEKPPPVYTKRTKIPDNTPTFCNRPKVVHERKPAPPPQVTTTMTRTEQKTRQMMCHERIPIPSAVQKQIPNRAPKCARNPDDYTRDRIKEIVRRKYGVLENTAETMTIESELDGTETLTEFPSDRKSRRQKLLEVLDENSDVEEWEVPVVEKYGISDPSSDFNDENDFTIAEELLTDTEEGLDMIRPKPVYYDPHETRAVKLRNQAVKQKLALREMKKRLEEEDEDERQWRRKKVGKEVAPALKQLEAMSTFRKEDIDEKRRRKNADNMNRAVAPLCSAIRSAENTDFMVKRETRVVQRQSDRNGRRHEERERQVREEEEKRKIRGQRKKKVMDLWKA